jgi:phosphoribosylglycinamide formyltransferase 1
MSETIRLGACVSGGGTTVQNFVDRIAAGRLQASVEVVVASRPGIKGIERAEKAGIPVVVVQRKAYADVEAFSEAVFGPMREHKVDLVTLAGFLSLVRIPDDFAGRVLNIHPALVPAFCGKGYYGHHVHEAVLEFGAKVSGCTVHFADNVYDHGPIIVQRAVPVLDDDTADTLAERVFGQECEAYPEAIELFRTGQLQVDGKRVRIIDE